MRVWRPQIGLRKLWRSLPGATMLSCAIALKALESMTTDTLWPMSVLPITHRVTGVLMFFASFLLLWALDLSLASEASFNSLGDLLSSPLAKGVSWAIASILTYHALAGIKHLIMDAGIGETMRGGVLGARIVFVSAAISAVVWGLLIW